MTSAMFTTLRKDTVLLEELLKLPHSYSNFIDFRWFRIPLLDQICHILQIEEGNRNRVMLGLKAQGIVHVLSPEKK